jgi:P-type Mg2+ transporter
MALVVGLTPEALPAVTTFSLSRGAALLAHHKVIVKRLSAIEDLGAITVLCTDKTGTLTENILSVSDWFPISDTVLLYAQLLALRPETDPFDKALSEMKIDDKLKLSEYSVIEDQPFDPEKRISAIKVEKNGKSLVIIRGSLEDVIKRCLPIENKEADEQWLRKQNEEGRRVLAIAYKEGGNLEDTDLTLLGYTAFSDTIKKTAEQAVLEAHKLGIELKMVTGDSKEVGCYVARAIGLLSQADAVVSGEEFERMTHYEQQAAAKRCTVFARFLPYQKESLVNLLRNEGVIGFLGDGINDAPAVKAAHVGMVVQHASDVTKDAADIILLKKSLLVIVDGIAIGRRIFANTIKYITISISSSFGNFYSIAIASLFIDFLPLLPRQILLISFLSDFPMISLASDTIDERELKHPPNFNMRSIAFISMLLGLVSSVFDFIFFSYFFFTGPLLLQTTWFVESILSQIVLIFSLRTRLLFYKAPKPSLALVSLCGLVVLITLILPFTTLGDHLFHLTRYSKEDLGIIIIILLGYFVATEIVKLSYYYFMNHQDAEQSS